MNFPILSVTLFAPLAGALLIMVIPREDVKTIRRVGVIFTLVTLALALFIWVNLGRTGAAEMGYETDPPKPQPWIPAFDIYYNVGIDGLSAPMLFLTALILTDSCSVVIIQSPQFCKIHDEKCCNWNGVIELN